MHFFQVTCTIVRNKNIYFFSVEIECQLNFISEVICNNTVVRDENLYFFDDGGMSTEFFLSLMYDGSSVARNENIFLPLRVEHRLNFYRVQ